MVHNVFTALFCMLIVLSPLTESAAEQKIIFPPEWGKNLLASENGAQVVDASKLERTQYGPEYLIDGEIGYGPYCAWDFTDKSAFVVFKLVSIAEIDRVAFVNEQRPGLSHHAKELNISKSTDGTNWELVQNFFLTKSPEIQSLVFGEPITAGYLKFDIRSNYGDSEKVVLEEIAAFEVKDSFSTVFRGTTENDILELKNGDRLTGRMEVDEIELQTSYARLSFKKRHIASILFEDNDSYIEKIVVRNGDVFSGFVINRNFSFKLSTGLKIDIRREKIRRIGVRISPDERDTYPRQDLMILKNGDVFSGKITTLTLTVQTSYATVPTKTGDIALIEFTGKERAVTKVTLKNGNTFQGLLQEEDIGIALDSGPSVLIYQDKIERIEFLQ